MTTVTNDDDCDSENSLNTSLAGATGVRRFRAFRAKDGTVDKGEG